MDRDTVAVYEQAAEQWIAQRVPPNLDDARRFAARVAAGAWRADLGCGPGRHAAVLGRPAVALDAAFAMARAVRSHAPGAAPVRGDIEALPFRRGSLGGAWASASYLHVPAERLPLALADLHHALAIGAPIELSVGSGQRQGDVGDEFPGRLFTDWPPDRLADVVHGAGFALDEVRVSEGKRAEWVNVAARRMRSLPDTVGPGMRLLVAGLNPSEYAADAGCAFARPGNRFWPAAISAEIVTRDRDPLHALHAHGVGLTDLVKRASTRSETVLAAEYHAGVSRVERLVAWLRPEVVCFAGLAGYRAALDPTARPGPQPALFGGRPAYLMPNPSGANAHARLEDIVAHLRAALAFGAQPRPPGPSRSGG